MKMLTFEQALKESKNAKVKKTHILLGNGFSIACKPDIFLYGSLLSKANFDNLPLAMRAFAALRTTDFEVVMRALRSTVGLIDIYAKNETDAIKNLKKQMLADAEGLREVLVNAIAGNHPNLPSVIADVQYAHCRKFLQNFEKIYTLNYDLLLYWTLMHDELGEGPECNDGFLAPDDRALEYVTWHGEIAHGQNVCYLHGALHLFDSGIELKKYTWKNTKIPLIDQVRSALSDNMYPVIVAEGESRQKFERIFHSAYLYHGYKSLNNIGGSLFIFGHSLADNDRHILRAISNNKVEKLFISLYDKPGTKINRAIIQRSEEIRKKRRGNTPLELFYYDAESTEVWD